MIAVYARQSVEKRDSISIEGQVEVCCAEVRGRPFEIYADRGYSGKNLRRPSFMRLMEDIRAGRIESVLVYKLDRISRSILDFSNLMEYFDAHQVSFVSMTEKFDTSSPIGRAMLHLCAVFAQLERETIQQRVEEAYWMRSKKGFYMGGRIPYGFAKEPFEKDGIHTSKFQAIAEEADQVRQLYNLYARGYSLGEIQNIFEKRGIRKLRGSSWNPSRMSEMLKNPVYVSADREVYHYYQEVGAILVNQVEEFCGAFGCYLYHRKDGGKELVLAPHHGIIEASVWLRCQRRFSQPTSVRSEKRKISSWLIGRVHCDNCGYALVVRYAKTKWGRYLVCSRKGISCHGSGTTVYVGALEAFLEKKIKRCLCFLEERYCCDTEENRRREREYQKKVSDLDRQIGNLISHQSDFCPQALQYINQKVAQLDDAKRKLMRNYQEQKRNHPLAKDRILSKLWENSSPRQRQLVLSQLVSDIRIKDGKVLVIWRLSDTTFYTVWGSAPNCARSSEF